MLKYIKNIDHEEFSVPLDRTMNTNLVHKCGLNNELNKSQKNLNKDFLNL